MSERKIKAWQQAGLIDADTATRIRAWEAAHARPLGVWAIVGLGALTIGLGIVSVVAANWDAIPGEVRLALHFALMAGLAAMIVWRPRASSLDDYFHDALLFLAAVLGLTFFAHVGQVYQTSSPLWQPLLAWLVIFSPLLLLFGRGWPIAALWMAGVLGTAWAHADEYQSGFRFDGSVAAAPAHPEIYWGLIFCPPMIVAALAAVMRGRSERPSFWRLLEQLALVAIFAGLSLFIVAGAWDGTDRSFMVSIAIQSLAIGAAAAAIFAARRTRSGQATAAILAVGAVLHLAARTVSTVEGPWIGTLLFLMLWGAVAGGALYAGWRRIFQAAVALIALRIIILSFELNDLLGGGVGLILSGAFAMAVAWATIRISRKYAPVRETAHD